MYMYTTKKCSSMFTAMVFVIVPNKKQSQCPLTVEWINDSTSYNKLHHNNNKAWTSATCSNIDKTIWYKRKETRHKSLHFHLYKVQSQTKPTQGIKSQVRLWGGSSDSEEAKVGLTGYRWYCVFSSGWCLKGCHFVKIQWALNLEMNTFPCTCCTSKTVNLKILNRIIKRQS